MFMDSRLEFSDAQALTGTAASTNVIDISDVRQIGKGRPVYLVVIAEVAPDSADGDETYNVELQTDDADSFGSPVALFDFDIDRGAGVGAKFIHTVPYENVEQFLRLNYTLGGTSPSITLNAFLTDQEPESWEALPDADN